MVFADGRTYRPRLVADAGRAVCTWLASIVPVRHQIFILRRPAAAACGLTQLPVRAARNQSRLPTKLSAFVPPPPPCGTSETVTRALRASPACLLLTLACRPRSGAAFSLPLSLRTSVIRRLGPPERAGRATRHTILSAVGYTTTSPPSAALQVASDTYGNYIHRPATQAATRVCINYRANATEDSFWSLRRSGLDCARRYSANLSFMLDLAKIRNVDLLLR